MWRNWVPHILLVAMGNDAGILEYNLGIPQKVKKGFFFFFLKSCYMAQKFYS